MVAVIIITFPGHRSANVPEPPLRQAAATLTDAARAISVLRDFDAFASLPADIQRDLWRHHADLIRAARRPIAAALRSWPTDGDAA